MGGGLCGRPWALPVIRPLQFQGTWYAIGLAQNTFKDKCLSQPAMHMVTYELNGDHGYDATYAQVR